MEVGREMAMERPVRDDGEDLLDANYTPKRNIEISPLDYGYIVRVGCQSVAIESKEDLIRYLTKYLENPAEAERKYNRNEFLDKQITSKTI